MKVINKYNDNTYIEIEKKDLEGKTLFSAIGEVVKYGFTIVFWSYGIIFAIFLLLVLINLIFD